MTRRRPPRSVGSWPRQLRTDRGRSSDFPVSSVLTCSVWCRNTILPAMFPFTQMTPHLDATRGRHVIMTAGKNRATGERDACLDQQKNPMALRIPEPDAARGCPPQDTRQAVIPQPRMHLSGTRRRQSCATGNARVSWQDGRSHLRARASRTVGAKRPAAAALYRAGAKSLREPSLIHAAGSFSNIFTTAG